MFQTSGLTSLRRANLVRSEDSSSGESEKVEAVKKYVVKYTVIIPFFCSLKFRLTIFCMEKISVRVIVQKYFQLQKIGLRAGGQSIYIATCDRPRGKGP